MIPKSLDGQTRKADVGVILAIVALVLYIARRTRV
jgi:hypothetical protein